MSIEAGAVGVSLMLVEWTDVLISFVILFEENGGGGKNQL